MTYSIRRSDLKSEYREPELVKTKCNEIESRMYEQDISIQVPEGERRQFRCNSADCGGRVWTKASTCYRCNQQGPVGEEIQLHQFKCDCDDHDWYERAEISVCRSCNENGVLIPIGEELGYRQFMCDNCDGRRWIAMAERSQCQLCNNFGELIPVKEEIGVFVCKFVCDCEQCGCARNRKKYHVICEMSDTAICYRCRNSGHLDRHVTPYGFLPRRQGRRIRRMTDIEHDIIPESIQFNDKPSPRHAPGKSHSTAFQDSAEMPDPPQNVREEVSCIHNVLYSNTFNYIYTL